MPAAILALFDSSVDNGQRGTQATQKAKASSAELTSLEGSRKRQGMKINF